jgi:hypothetical protein
VGEGWIEPEAGLVSARRREGTEVRSGAGAGPTESLLGALGGEWGGELPVGVELGCERGGHPEVGLSVGLSVSVREGGVVRASGVVGTRTRWGCVGGRYTTRNG